MKIMENVKVAAKPSAKKVWDGPRKIIIAMFPTYKKPSKS
jgi:hypothetical protein